MGRCAACHRPVARRVEADGRRGAHATVAGVSDAASSASGREAFAGRVSAGRTTLVLGSVLLANLVAQPLRGLRYAVHTDFVAFVTGGRILHAGSTCLYCPATQAAVQTRLLGFAPSWGIVPYANPPLFAYLIQPLALLPLRAAMAVFLGLSLLALGGAAVLLARWLPREWPLSQRSLLLIASVALLPGAESFAWGQLDPLLLLAAAAAMGLMAQRPLIAGALLSVLVAKPQLVWLAVPALVLIDSWRVLLGFAAGTAVWLVSGLMILGGQHLADWLRYVLPAHVGEAGKTVGFPAVAGGSASFALATLLAAIAVGVAWRLRETLRSNPAACVSLGLAASLVCAPHVYSQDLLLLAPLLVIWGGRHPGAALLAALALDGAYLLDQSLAPLHAEAIATAAILLAVTRSLARPAASRPATTPERPAAPRAAEWRHPDRASPAPSPR